MKILAEGTALFHAGGRADRHDKANSLHNRFANLS